MVLLLIVPAVASAADVRVSAFYYPWYGTPALDGAYQHWSQNGHTPPNDIASSYYPARGIYSSSDRLVLGAQMDEIEAAGIDEVAVSWWGRGSPEDARLSAVVAAAQIDGLAVAVHIEPYPGRTVATIVSDLAYLRTSASGRSTSIARSTSRSPTGRPRRPHCTSAVRCSSRRRRSSGAAAAAGFNGIYTYDIVTYSGNKFARICSEAHAMHLLCAPSVGPGYDARRAGSDPRVKPRRHGATYDAMWRAALAAKADRVTITSFNEWHEGTQIEPADATRHHGTYRYLSYGGAWGLHGVAAENAYLERTRYWADVFHSTSAPQLKTRAS